MVTARIELDGSFLYGIERLIFKPLREPRILLNGRSYRLVRGSAIGPLILSYPDDPSFALGHLNFDSESDYRTIALEGLYGAAVIEFWEIPVAFG